MFEYDDNEKVIEHFAVFVAVAVQQELDSET